MSQRDFFLTGKRYIFSECILFIAIFARFSTIFCVINKTKRGLIIQFKPSFKFVKKQELKIYFPAMFSDLNCLVHLNKSHVGIFQK